MDLKCENDHVIDVSLLREIEKNFKSTFIKEVLRTYKQYVSLLFLTHSKKVLAFSWSICLK